MTGPDVSERHLQVDPTTLRSTMAHVPTGVAVVTAASPDGPVGLTVGSFVSASLDPPLLGFLVQHTSTSWPLIAPLDRFCVNVLGEDAADVGQAFARKGGDKFGGVSWQPGPSGVPILSGATAWFQCRPAGIHEAGDHLFVLGEIDTMSVDADIRPLIFCHGRFQRLSA